MIIFTAHAQPDLLALALRAGASGYVLKSAPAEDIAKAVKAVTSGGTFLGGDFAGGKPSEVEKLLDLSPRERQILELLAEGLRVKEIAERLCAQPGDRPHPRPQRDRQARGRHPHRGGGPGRPLQLPGRRRRGDLARALGAVDVAALGGEQVDVGEAEQLLGGGAVGREHREAGGAGERQLLVVAEAAAGDAGAHPGGHFLRLLGVGLGDDHGELVAALAEDRVLGPDLVAQRRADSASRRSPSRWPKPLVDLLEAVEVEQDQGELAPWRRWRAISSASRSCRPR